MSFSPSFFNRTVTIKPVTATLGAGGITQRTQGAAIHSDLAVSIQPYRPVVSTQNNAQQLRITHVVYCETDLSDVPDDAVLTDDLDRTFICHGTGDEAGMGELYSLRVEELKNR